MSVDYSTSIVWGFPYPDGLEAPEEFDPWEDEDTYAEYMITANSWCDTHPSLVGITVLEIDEGEFKPFFEFNISVEDAAYFQDFCLKYNIPWQEPQFYVMNRVS